MMFQVHLQIALRRQQCRLCYNPTRWSDLWFDSMINPIHYRWIHHEPQPMDVDMLYTKPISNCPVNRLPNSNIASFSMSLYGAVSIDWNAIETKMNSVEHSASYSWWKTCKWWKSILTTQLTAFRWPTKSLSHFHPFRSIICAVGPPEEKTFVFTWKFPKCFAFVYLRSWHGLILNIIHRVTMINVKHALYRHIHRMAHWWPVHNPNPLFSKCAQYGRHFVMPKMCRTKMKIKNQI